jgi:hypothetical protein
MPAAPLRSARFLWLAAVGVSCGLVVVAATSGSPWPEGVSYYFWYSGMAGWDDPPTVPSGAFGALRTFGSPTSHITISGSLTDSLWDMTDTTGLPSDQVRLIFHLAPDSVESGWLRGRLFVFDGPALPSGAAFLPDTARMTFDYVSGSYTIGPTYNGSGIFYTSGPMYGAYAYWFDARPGLESGLLIDSGDLVNPTGITYEIVVDNVPEPATVGLFAAGALAMMTRVLGRGRRKAGT